MPSLLPFLILKNDLVFASFHTKSYWNLAIRFTIRTGRNKNKKKFLTDHSIRPWQIFTSMWNIYLGHSMGLGKKSQSRDFRTKATKTFEIVHMVNGSANLNETFGVQRHLQNGTIPENFMSTFILVYNPKIRLKFWIFYFVKKWFVILWIQRCSIIYNDVTAPQNVHQMT